MNEDVLIKFEKKLIADGADGFYVAGATGEGILLPYCERIKIAEASIEAAEGKVPVIVHIASCDFNEAQALAKHAERAGAKAISAIPPLFYKYDEDDVYNYYKKLASAVNIPLVIYYNPSAGFAINARFAARMFEIDNITAIKWTSPDYHGMMQLKELTHGEMNIINGPDEMLLMGLSAGADAGIGTTYNFMLPLIRGVYDSFKDGNIEGAREYQSRVGNIISAMRAYPTIPLTKALVSAMGFDVGDAAFPLKALSEKTKAEAVKNLTLAGWSPSL